VVIVDETGGGSRVIGEMDRPGAKELIFDDAVYIHLGRQYIVRKLDIENRTCHVAEKDVDYWTDAVVKTDIEVLTEDERFFLAEARGGQREDGLPRAVAECVLGDVLVRSQAEKFKKLRFHSHENVGYGEISLPSEEMQTRAIVLLFPPGTVAGEALGEGRSEAFKAAVLSGAGRLLHDIAPAFLMCDPRDLGRAERVRDPHFECPAIYFYDRYPGGTGLAEGLAQMLATSVSAARERLSTCPCGGGCPSCIGVDFADAGVPGPGPSSALDGSEVKARVLDLFGALGGGG
jgi:DEAD/DEAH box helicase domain-containing protein